jgi:hypothetical protein
VTWLLPSYCVTSLWKRIDPPLRQISTTLAANDWMRGDVVAVASALVRARQCQVKLRKGQIWSF